MTDDRPVLVAYGSKYGGTEEIARWIGDDLRGAGLSVDVRPADRVVSVEPYQAVVLGSGIYGERWHHDARRMVHRTADAMRQRPVWLFSSGPLDASADEHVIPPVRGVARVVRNVRARDHVTFGGRLQVGTPGLIARMLARKLAGDYRNREQVHAYADAIAHHLSKDRRSGTSGSGAATDGAR